MLTRRQGGGFAGSYNRTTELTVGFQVRSLLARGSLGFSGALLGLSGLLRSSFGVFLGLFGALLGSPGSLGGRFGYLCMVWVII